MPTRKSPSNPWNVRTVKLYLDEPRRVDPRKLAEALGAEIVGSAPELRGSTPAMLTARAELLHRLRSTGGRPALQGATKRRQVSFRPEDWKELERIASALEEREGIKTTPGQVASALLHHALAGKR